jgi:hypothetical protein
VRNNQSIEKIHYTDSKNWFEIPKYNFRPKHECSISFLELVGGRQRQLFILRPHLPHVTKSLARLFSRFKPPQDLSKSQFELSKCLAPSA